MIDKKNVGKIMGMFFLSSVVMLISVSVSYAAPQFTTQGFAYPNGSTYQGTWQNFGFQINATDNNSFANDIANIKNVSLEINYTGTLTNWTATNSSPNGIYTYNITGGLGVASYQFRWVSANETVYNATAMGIYNVTLNETNPVQLNNNGAINGNSSINEGDASTMTASAIYSNSGTIKLYMDGSDVTSAQNGVATYLSVNEAGYNYTVGITGNGNFSSNTTGLLTAKRIATFLYVNAYGGGGPSGGGSVTPSTTPTTAYQPVVTPTTVSQPTTGGGFNIGSVLNQIKMGFQNLINQIMAIFRR